MKIKIRLLLIFVVVLFSLSTNYYSQNRKSIPCQPTADEIMRFINLPQPWDFRSEKILIVGEIKGPQILKLSKESLLTSVIAMTGGVSKTAKQPLYLVRHSAETNAIKIINADINEIKRGNTENIILKQGDLVYVSRGCVDGKLLPPTEPINLSRQPSPSLLDAPINNVKRIY